MGSRQRAATAVAVSAARCRGSLGCSDCRTHWVSVSGVRVAWGFPRRLYRTFPPNFSREQRKRGPAPRWRNPRKPAKTIVHVNTHKIKENQKHNLQQPVITAKKQCNRGEPTLFFSDATQPMTQVEPTTGCINLYGHEVEILGGCRVVYSPDSSKHGAKVWYFDYAAIEHFGKLNVSPALL